MMFEFESGLALGPSKAAAIEKASLRASGNS